MVFLATDLDREGEAIAWHVAEAANVPRDRTRRVTFSEITEPAIREAFANPRDIDQNLVDAQQTRRDRGPARRLHAQPAARQEGPARPVGRSRPVGRRPARRRARAGDHGIHGPRVLDDPGAPRDRGRRVVPGGPGPDRRRADSRSSTRRPRTRTSTAIRELQPVVDEVGRSRPRSDRRPPPFTTSTLQQEASRRLGFSPKRTMSVAQRLYEGVETPDGHVGLITYMRTDSTAMAGVAMGEAREVIGQRYGDAVHDAQGSRLQDQDARAPRRRTSRSGRPASSATRIRCRPTSSRTRRGCTGSSGSARSRPRWRRRSSRRRPSSSPTAATSCARPRRKVLFDGFCDRLHRGPRRRVRGRRGRRRRPGCRRSPKVP